MKRIRFANTFVDSIEFSETAMKINENIKLKKKTHIVFLNALKISEIQNNIEIKKAMHEAEMILADGMPIVWFSKFFGGKLPSRVNGTDLFESILKIADENGYRVFLLGATQNNLEKLIESLNKKYPKLKITSRNGYFSEEDDEDVINQINESKSEILFIGFSSPKKEVWANKYKHAIQTPIIQGVGGSFDVLAGVIPRAPKWMQNSGLEWLFRVFMEPKRMFKRYLVSNFHFFLILVKSIIFKSRIIG